MARFGSDTPAGGDEENLLDPLAEDNMKVNLLPPEEPEGQRFSLRRILLLVGVVVIVLGGGYLAYSLFLAPPPPAPVPLARAPVPVAKAPTPVPSPAPAPPAPAAKAPEPAKAPEVAKTPPAKAAEPAKTPDAAKGAPATQPEPAKTTTAKAATGVPLAPSKAPDASKATPPSAMLTAKAAKDTVPGGYSLQVGAMAIQANAETLKKRLDGSGFPCSVRKGTAHLNKHVVSVGEPTGRGEAEEMARRLNVDGFPSQVVAVGGKYVPEVGAFLNQDEAIDLARDVQKKQYRPKITQRPVTTEVYQVRHGEFDSRAAAMKRGEELKAKGFSVFVVRN